MKKKMFALMLVVLMMLPAMMPMAFAWSYDDTAVTHLKTNHVELAGVDDALWSITKSGPRWDYYGRYWYRYVTVRATKAGTASECPPYDLYAILKIRYGDGVNELYYYYSPLPVVQYTHTFILSGEGGKGPKGSIVVNEGDAYSYAPVCRSGYRLDYWKIDDGETVTTSTANPLIGTVSGDLTITAEYRLKFKPGRRGLPIVLPPLESHAARWENEYAFLIATFDPKFKGMLGLEITDPDGAVTYSRTFNYWKAMDYFILYAPDDVLNEDSTVSMTQDGVPYTDFTVYFIGKYGQPK